MRAPGAKISPEIAIADKSAAPLEVGRADALNARTLQLMSLAGLFDELYPQGKPVNTSSVWGDGKFVSRQSAWWDALEGCCAALPHDAPELHGEGTDRMLTEANRGMRQQEIVSIEAMTGDYQHLVTLSNGEKFEAKVLIGSDGSRSFVRDHFKVPFEITRPQIVWAVIDGVLDTDFPKVNEIIVFQAETSDVAWIPRERDIDRFYVRMDVKDFTMEDAVAKINRAMKPYTLKFKSVSGSLSSR